MEINESFKLANGQIPLSLSPKFVLPGDKRPNISKVESLSSIPVVDLKDENDHNEIVKKVSNACEDYGFFQVINHGVDEKLCQDMMGAIFSFFNLPPEERSVLYSEDITKLVKVYNYHLKVEGQDEKVTMWSEVFSHPWDPLNGDFTHLLPKNPPQYREHIVEYAKEIGGLMTRLLGLISEGLGLDKNCLKAKIGDNPRLRAQANFYPECPEPELTLGLPTHTDFTALTILLQSQDVCGLHIIKDGNWVAVNPFPNALVVNLGDQIQVLSNGRYKSVHHRAVSNKDRPRASLAMFYGPNADVVISPIKDLIDDEHPPLYRSYRFAEFLDEFKRQEGTRRMVKEVFELPN